MGLNMSRFGGNNREVKKQTVIDKLKLFFEKYFGLVQQFKRGCSQLDFKNCFATALFCRKFYCNIMFANPILRNKSVGTPIEVFADLL